MFALGPWYLRLCWIGSLLVHRWVRYALAWVLAIGAAGYMTYSAWTYYNRPERADGNDGHTSVDFGGQWIMGRMLVMGEGHNLYERNHMREVLREGFPLEDQGTAKKGEKGDAEELIYFSLGTDDREAAEIFTSCVSPLMGADPLGTLSIMAAGQERAWTPEKMERASKRAIGGAIYPPVNALFNYPLALFRPQIAYRIRQIGEVVLVFLAALAVSILSRPRNGDGSRLSEGPEGRFTQSTPVPVSGRLSEGPEGRFTQSTPVPVSRRGKVWVPCAMLMILFFPDYFGNQILAQNAMISLNILVWGWVLISRNHEIVGGLVWGLFSFKPTWAMPFFFVLLLTRRWRGCLAMLGMGAILGLITLPFVGIHSWFEWLQVGKEAAWGHRIYANWVRLSRNLFGIPRRFMVDFDAPEEDRDFLEVNIACWALYLFVAEIAIRLVLFRGKKSQVVRGTGAAFILASGWLCCLQFMYYDVLLAFVPVMLVLFTSRIWQTHYLRQTPLQWEALDVKPWSELNTAPQKEQVQYTCGRISILSLPTTGAYGWIKNPLAFLPIIMLFAVQTYLEPRGYFSIYNPINTYCLLALWLWCAWAWSGEKSTVETKPQETVGFKEKTNNLAPNIEARVHRLGKVVQAS